jgi:hypothetical protein
VRLTWGDVSATVAEPSRLQARGPRTRPLAPLRFFKSGDALGVRVGAVLTAALNPTKLRADGSHRNFEVELVVSNNGERDAERTEVAVYVPAFVDTATFAWQDQRHDRSRARARQVPGLKVGDREQWDVRCLERSLDNVPTRMPVSPRLVLPLPIPQEPMIPIRVVLRAEHADEPLTQDLSVSIAYGLRS